MNVADIHVRPSAKVVADLVDSDGMFVARERWGWLDQSTLTRLAREGRRLAGRKPSTGTLQASARHQFLNPGWDGVPSERFTVPAAAEVLGLSAATLTRGSA